MTIRDVLADRLRRVLGTTAVYPNFAWVAEDGRGGAEVTGPLPAVVYRQVGGDRFACGDGAADDDYRTDEFLVEFFAPEATACHALRLAAEAAFRGPPGGDPVRPGEPAGWVAGGPTVHWAEAADPRADAEYPAAVAHQLLCFEQVVLTVTHSR